MLILRLGDGASLQVNVSSFRVALRRRGHPKITQDIAFFLTIEYYLSEEC